MSAPKIDYAKEDYYVKPSNAEDGDKYGGLFFGDDTVVSPGTKLARSEEDLIFNIVPTEKPKESYDCSFQKQQVRGIGPYCGFQQIGVADSYRCIIEKRSKCHAEYYKGMEQCGPRDKFNCNVWSYYGYAPRALNISPGVLIPGNAEDSFAEEDYRKGKPPKFSQAPCKINFFLGNSATICCDAAISGKECIGILRLDENLAECLEKVDKECECKQCEGAPEDDDSNESQGGNDTKESKDAEPKEATKTQDALERQETTISSYDGVIPVTAGFFPVKGNIIWLGNYKFRDKTLESSYSGDTEDKTKRTSTVEVTASFAVALARGEVGGVAYILQNGKPIYRTAGIAGLGLPDAEHFSDLFSPTNEGLNAEDIERMKVTVYNGERGQRADPVILELTGPLGAAANRDLVYAVFDDVPLKSFAQNLPNLTFYLYDTVENTTVTNTSEQIATATETLVPNFLSQDLDGNVVVALRNNLDGQVKPVTLSNGLSARSDRAYQQADEDSLYLLRDGSVIGHKGTSGRVPMVRWSGTGNMTFYGTHQAGIGHSGTTLAASGRTSGALMKSMPSAFAYDRFDPLMDQRFDVPAVEVIAVSSQQDDLAVLSKFEDTNDVVRNPYTYYGSVELDRANCISNCLALEQSYCPGNCSGGFNTSYETFNPNWTILNVDLDTNEILVETGDGSEIFALDFIDGSGNIFIVGEIDPIGIRTATAEGGATDTSGCVSTCNLEAELYCQGLCNAGVAVIQALALGRRATEDFTAEAKKSLSQGFTAYSVTYPAATEIEVFFFRVNAAFSDLLTTSTSALPTIGTIPMTAYGGNSSPTVKAVFESQRYDKNWLLVGTSSGDYIIGFDVATGTVDYSVPLTVPLPTTMGSGERRLRWPSTDYLYIGKNGKIGTIDLATGANSVLKSAPVSNPSAQYYDPESQSIVYIFNGVVSRHYPKTSAVSTTTVSSALTKVYLIAGLTYAEFRATLEDPILGVVFEDSSSTKQFVEDTTALFGASMADNGVLSETIAVTSVTPEIRESATTTKRGVIAPVHKVTVSSITIGSHDKIKSDVARNEIAGSDKTYDIKAYLYPDQGRVMASTLLLRDNESRGKETTLVVGPRYLGLAVNSLITVDDITYRVSETTLDASRHLLTGIEYADIKKQTAFTFNPIRDVVEPQISGRILQVPALDDADALIVHGGGAVVYAGVVSPDEVIPEQLVGLKGGSSRIAVNGINKPLHSGTMTLPANIQDILTPDRKTVLTLNFDRESSASIPVTVPDIRIINDQWANLIFAGDELIQFTTVVARVGKTVQVTGLYRGRNGTHGTLTRPNVGRRAAFYLLTRDTVFTGTTSASNVKDYELREVITARQSDQFERVNAKVFNKPYGAMLQPPGGLLHTRIPVTAEPDKFGWLISWAPSSVFTHKQAIEPLLTTPEEYAVTIWKPFSYNGADYRHHARHMREVVLNAGGDDKRQIETFTASDRSLVLTESYLTSKGFSLSSIYTSLIVSVSQVHPITGIAGIPAFEVFPLSSQRF